MNVRMLPVLIAASLCAPVAGAVDLVSPSLSAGFAGNALDCRIVNLSGREQAVTITSYDSTGGLVGSNTINVAAGGWGGVSLPYENGAGAGYCRFSVPGAHRASELRASINVMKADFGIIASLPAY